jgi:hypothetical protein
MLVKKSEQPVLNAFLFVSLLFFINLVSFSLLLELTFKFELLNFENYQTIYWIGIILGCMTVNFFNLIYKRKYTKIIQHFNNINKPKSYNIEAIVYILASIILLLVLLGYLTFVAH